MKKITVIGDGGWGTTLARHLFKKGYNVFMWSAFKEYAVLLRKKRRNPKYLPQVIIPKGLKITADAKEALDKAELVVLAVPSQYLKGVLGKIKSYIPDKAVILSVVKGIEEKGLLRMSELINKELGRRQVAVLSGPTIAYEVARGMPATCVVAASDARLAGKLQKVFITERLRVYTNKDVIGVELGGSLKNIIAIAAGISDGLGYGINTKAALVTRGIAEIARLGRAMGARKETFAGLSGLGDLVTTCMSKHSRNRQVGEAIAGGKSLKKVLASMDMVAEGVTTVKSASKLSKKYKVDMPITAEIYKVLYKKKHPERAVNDLMRRQRKGEFMK